MIKTFTSKIPNNFAQYPNNQSIETINKICEEMRAQWEQNPINLTTNKNHQFQCNNEQYKQAKYYHNLFQKSSIDSNQGNQQCIKKANIENDNPDTQKSSDPTLYLTENDGSKRPITIPYQPCGLPPERNNSIFEQTKDTLKNFIRTMRGTYNRYAPGLYSVGVIKNKILMAMGKLDPKNAAEITIKLPNGVEQTYKIIMSIQPAEQHYSIDEMKSDGVKAVISFQEPHENGLPLLYSTYTKENYALADISFSVFPTPDYNNLTVGYLKQVLPQIHDIFTMVMDSKEGLVFQCKSGIGRTGAMTCASITYEQVLYGENPLTAFKNGATAVRMIRDVANVNQENTEVIMKTVIEIKAEQIVKEKSRQGIETSLEQEVKGMKWMIKEAVNFSKNLFKKQR